MNCSSDTQVPALVHIVLSQIARLGSLGELSEAEVISKTARLVREELRPRGLRLHRFQMPGGRLRFVVETANGGEVCDTVEYGAGSDSEFAVSRN
jgi:hypothetical protein